jgi:hypothetical protein
MLLAKVNDGAGEIPAGDKERDMLIYASEALTTVGATCGTGIITALLQINVAKTECSVSCADISR